MKLAPLTLALALWSAPAGAYGLKAVPNPAPVWPSREAFIQHELDGKAYTVLSDAGAWLFVEVTWGNGKVERIAIGPTPAGFAVVAREFVR